MKRGEDTLAPPGALLSWRAVRALTGVSRTTVWRLRKAGRFPDPVVVSPGRVAWREGEVAAWTAGLAPRGDPSTAAGPRAEPPQAAPADKPQDVVTQVAIERSRRSPPSARPPARRARRPAASNRQMSFDF